jgi:hypothetical protein
MDQHQAQQFGMAIIGAVVVLSTIVTAIMVWLFWRALTKAGLSGPLALLALIPGVGFFIPLAILAFSDWPAVRPVTTTPYYPPVYPPPPPPSAFQAPPQV